MSEAQEKLPDLPQGWAHAKIGEICSLVNGRAFKAEDWSSCGLPIIRIQNLNNHDAEFNYCSFDVEDKYYVDDGQLLFAWSGTPGTSFGAHIWSRGKGILNQHIFKVNINEKYLNKKFLMNIMNYNVDLYIKKAHGTAGLAHITKGKFEESLISLPPLNEQHRIVACIEELFSRLDAGVEALRRARSQLQRYRQSVLQAAVEGRLTAEWRDAHPEVEPAEELLERTEFERQSKMRDKYKNAKFNGALLSSGLNDSWTLTTIGHVAECLDYIRVPINKKERAKRVGSIPYYGANGQVGWIDDFLFDESLVLVVEDETFTGREKPFSYKITGRSWVNNHAHVLRATAAVDVDYLNYSLQYYPFTPLTTGTTGRKKLTQQALMSATYALPPLMEQKEIVKRIESHFSSGEQVERTIEASLKYSNPLSQSILKRAFEGRLVPQDPNDEPASLLLERIRAERTKPSQPKGRRRSINQASLIP